MVKLSPQRPLAIAGLVIMSVLLAAQPGGFAAAAQGDEVAVMLRAFACPNNGAAADDPFTECDAMIGATFQIEANGAMTSESPATIVRDTGIGPGALIHVPAGAELIITQLSGAPAGYVPASGFDPFSANVDDLPQVGFGGESTGPGVTFISVPADDSGDNGTGDESGDEDARDTTELPTTGTGTTTSASHETVPMSLLLAVLAMIGGGCIMRRTRAS